MSSAPGATPGPYIVEMHTRYTGGTKGLGNRYDFGIATRQGKLLAIVRDCGFNEDQANARLFQQSLALYAGLASFLRSYDAGGIPPASVVEAARKAVAEVERVEGGAGPGGES